WIDPPAAPVEGGAGGAASAADGARPGQTAATPDARAAASAAAAAPPAPGIEDWFWVPSFRSLPLPAPRHGSPVAPGERWLLFAGDTAGHAAGGERAAAAAGLGAPAGSAGLGARLAARLRSLGQTVAVARPGPGFSAGAAAADGGGEETFTVDPARPGDYTALLAAWRGAGGEPPSRILHLWGMTAPAAGELPLAAALDAGVVSLTLLAQAIAAAGGTGPVRLTLVANGLAAALDGDPIHPGKAGILGAVKVVHQEVPRLFAQAVDAPLPAPGTPAEALLAEQLLLEASTPPAAATLVALRGRQRFVRRFERVRLPAPAEREGEGLGRGGSFLIAGASLGPGPAIAEHLVRRCGARVALVLPPDPAPPGSGGAAAGRLLALGQEAGPERALVLHAAPGDAAALGAALAAARARWGPLRGIFWTGGPAAGGLLQLATPAALRAALAPAAGDAAALLAALDGPRQETPPFVLLCSTTTAVTGGLGLLELAAAGSHLEALAARRAAAGSAAALVPPPVAAVHWDPYQWEGWLVAGVAGEVAGLAQEVEAGLGAHRVAAERSAAAMEHLLASPLPAAIVCARDLDGLIAETDSVTAEALLAHMTPAGAPRDGARAPRPDLAAPYAPPRDELEQGLAAIWQELFGIAPVGRDDSFLELGGHSLLAIQIVTQVRQRLAADLPVTALFEAPTVAQLAQAVRRTRGELDPAETEELLALVEGLSPQEAAARLQEMQAGETR
ncbi:MAG TPA: phosphopantetheine-binding protein, partial [Thermoanaerobaculia bacterium]|nr:phosphopantetheine-binding protein [Thermoanaerobaculia bacterium]